MWLGYAERAVCRLEGLVWPRFDDVGRLEGLVNLVTGCIKGVGVWTEARLGGCAHTNGTCL